MSTFIYYKQAQALHAAKQCGNQDVAVEWILANMIEERMPVKDPNYQYQHDDPRLVIKIQDGGDKGTNFIQCFVMGKGIWSVRNTLYEVRNPF